MNRNNRDSWSDLSDRLALLEEPGAGLSASRRSRILREARAAQARRAAGASGPRLPAVAWASGAILALVVALATPALISTDVQSVSQNAAMGTGARLIMADYQDGEMILEWENGGRESYTVRQATDIRQVRQAPGVKVRGRRFVERISSDERVLFFVVE